jgi:hypothetical protein
MKEDEKRQSTEPEKESQAPAMNAMTRREWLQGLSGAALAAGWPAVPSGAQPAAGLTPETATLPPGLYTPSPEHLGHALERDGLTRATPPGSQTDYVQLPAGAFRPAFFSQTELAVIRRMVEIVLALRPGTDDQLGRSGGEDVVAEVARWIDLRAASAAPVRTAARALSPQHRGLATHYYGPETVRRLETDTPDRIYREGLGWVEEVSQQKYGAGFLKLGEPQQLEIFESISDQIPHRTRENAGTRLFKLLKLETIRAYYTSRRGLQELDYKGNAFYTTSPGCPESGKP